MTEKIKKFLIGIAVKKKKDFFSQLLSFSLFLFSLLYTLVIDIIIFLYKVKFLKKFEADCSVISIGNITVGGTGKTPFLIYLSERLLERKKQILISLSGYARDEAKEIKFFLPSANILAAKNRIAAIKKAAKEIKPQYIFLDDGFQHWKIKRNLDVVILDVSAPFKETKVLPAGFLREPVSHIKRADVVLLSRVNLVSQKAVDKVRIVLRKIKPDFKIFEIFFVPLNFYCFHDKKTVSLGSLKGKSVGVFCGIGNNRAFIETLKKIDIKIVSEVFFLDHHIYSQNDLDLISKDSKEKKLDVYITTFKDILKIDTSQLNVKVYCLAIGVKFKEKDDEDKFFGLIPGYLSA